MDAIFIPVIAILSTMIGLPGVIMFFIYKSKKIKHAQANLRYQKEILELEVRKEEAKLRRLEEENRKYDRMLDS